MRAPDSLFILSFCRPGTGLGKHPRLASELRFTYPRAIFRRNLLLRDPTVTAEPEDNNGHLSSRVAASLWSSKFVGT